MTTHADIVELLPTGITMFPSRSDQVLTVFARFDDGTLAT